MTPDKLGFTFTPASQSITVNDGNATVNFTATPVIITAITPAAAGGAAQPRR